MSRPLLLVTPGLTRRFEPAQLPVRVGAGSEADIRLPGAVGGGVIALIGSLDDRPFLQTTTPGAALRVNDALPPPTRWLADGDVITSGVLRIDCRFDAEALRLLVSYTDAGYVTLPPQAPDAAAPAIAPQRARAAPDASAAGGRRVRHALIYCALALLAAVAAHLFTARSVGVVGAPEGATLQLSGSLLPLRLGGRYLLRPGEYGLRAMAPGYVPLEQPFTVGDAPRQDVSITLAPLPGQLVLLHLPPGPVVVRIDGQEVAADAAGAFAAAAGARTLEVLAARHLPFKAAVEVIGRAERQEIPLALVPDWADVTLESEPAGATVSVGGEALGSTPVTVPVPSGAREIELRKDGYRPWKQRLEVAAGQKLALPPVRLQEIDGLLGVSSRPAGAAVTVDGRYRGVTPLEVEVSSTRAHEVIVALPGYEPVTRSVRVERRGTARLALDLVERVGRVRIASEPAGAEVFIDGERRGVAGTTFDLRAVEQKVELRKAGFVPWTTRITPKPGLMQVIEARLLTPADAAAAALPRTVTTGLGQVLVLVRPGEFVMGAPRREQGRRPNETERRVRLTRAFYLGTREVTNREFREFRPAHTSGAEKYQDLAGGSHPVVMLGWDDAAAFCNWLSERDGLPPAYERRDGTLRLVTPPTRGYRLPTEAEWAWAARYGGGGEARRYPWGGQMPPTEGSGNFADQSARGLVANVLSSYADGFPVTAPVGSFAAGPLGLFDLGGNAAEWVHDFYTVAAAGAGPEVDPMGPETGQYHVIRGSGWRSASVSELRFAYRDFGDQGRLDVGFRIARYAE